MDDKEKTPEIAAAEEAPAEEAKTDGNTEAPAEKPKSGGKKKKKKTKKQKLISSLIRFFVKLAVIAILVYVALTFVIGVFVMHSNDMYPSVRDGDLLITLKVKGSVYGDVVAYTVNGERHFGRVVAMPGDVVFIDESGRYTVNDLVPNETVYYETRTVESSNISFPYSVKEGELFLLNDLRDNGTDSRTYGAVPVENTDGSVVLMLRRRGW